MPRSNAILLVALAAFIVPAFGQDANPGRPGTLNYIEGQASLEGHQLTKNSVGRTELRPGQFLATGNGKAEILLTPGIFLRLGDNSTVKMVSPDLTRTEVELTQGRASVEVDQIYQQNKILIDLKNGQTQLLKNGLYDFNAADNTVRTIDGQALVFTSVTPRPDEKPVSLKGGKQLTLTGEAVTPVKFDRKQLKASDPLYTWSSLRSAYLGESNLDLAESYGGAGYTPGWFWNPYAYNYTWLPGGYGYFGSPFGYGFYSPYYLYNGGYIYGGYRGYPYRGGYVGRPGGHGGYPSRGGVYGSGSASRGSFHGGGAAQGGGGGFHGGGGAVSHGGGGASSHGGGGHR